MIRQKLSPITAPSHSVEIHVDPVLQEECHVVASVKDGGKVAIFEIGGLVPTDQGPIEVQIKPVDKRLWLGQQLREALERGPKPLQIDKGRNIHPFIGHTDNTSTSKEKGVIMNDDPFKVLKTEVVASVNFLGIKIAGGALHPVIVYLLGLPITTQVGYFTIMALFDCLVGIMPPVRKKTNSTVSATAIARFWQFCGSIAGLIVLLAMQSALKVQGAEATGVFSVIATSLFPLGVGTIGLIYGLRTIGSFYRLAYGEKAPNVRAKFANLLPDKFKKLKELLKDETISG